ncbi:NAD(P)-binding protein [Xylariaceae sp. FL0255]|nr:NAD(P)-binding protein [Xylariaceae sp. FL0255]
MPVVLVIAAGPGVGRAVAETFLGAGCTVAVASRSQKLDSPKYSSYEFDASQAKTIPTLFEKVKKDVGIPSVVVYNVYKNGDRSTFDFDELETFEKGLHANTVLFVAASRVAVDSFDTLVAQGKLGPEGATLIYIGNICNEAAFPGFMTMMMGKAASANFIDYMANRALKDKPYSFYYADERDPNRRPMYQGATPQPHVDEYLKLAQEPKQLPWQHTFVKGKGYVSFPRMVN